MVGEPIQYTVEGLFLLDFLPIVKKSEKGNGECLRDRIMSSTDFLLDDIV